MSIKGNFINKEFLDYDKIRNYSMRVDYNILTQRQAPWNEFILKNTFPIIEPDRNNMVYTKPQSMYNTNQRTQDFLSQIPGNPPVNTLWTNIIANHSDNLSYNLKKIVTQDERWYSVFIPRS